MAKIIVAFFIFIAISFTASSQKKQYKVIAIGSYNCENFFDYIHDTLKKDEEFTPDGAYHYTAEIYQQKLHNIATVIEKMATDITPDGAAVIGLVEIENDKVLNDLVSQPEIRDRHYKYVWFYTPDERGISTAMLYNPKYFQVLNAEPELVDLNLAGSKRPTRYILSIAGVLAGDTVHILVNHWPSKTGGDAATEPHRKLAATIAKRIVDSLLKVNPENKIIIMGDLNENPTEAAIKNILEPKSDKKETTLNDLYDPFITMYKKGLGTESYQGDWNMIDQIMVSGAMIKNPNKKWKYYDAEIFNREFLVNIAGRDKGLPRRSFTINKAWNNGYSDHFPVLMYLVEQ